MIFFAIFALIAAIGTMCWLQFTFAVFALPAYVGVSVGIWSYGAGAGWFGAIIIGLAAAGLTLALAQVLMMLVRPVCARLLIALVFVAPAGVAGYFATLGIVKHLMPSEAWQVAFAVIGAVAVGATAFFRIAGMAAADPTPGTLARS